MRRSHKKSRRGCIECKRRHIKCDETRPGCLNCTTAERACSYTPNPNVAVAATSPSTSTPSVPSPASAPPPPIPASTTRPSENVTAFPSGVFDEHPNVNMTHLELFNHSCSESHFGFALKPQLGYALKDIVVKHAFQRPYLMYQLLALAARHLSMLRPEKQAFYNYQAMQLQTHGLTTFNGLSLTGIPSPEEKVSVFLFCSMLGHHALCDTLPLTDKLKEQTFAVFLEKYTRYMRLHRSVSHVFRTDWHFFSESELKVVLIPSGVMAQATEPTGHECDKLRACITSATKDLPPSSAAACQKAIDSLQLGIEDSDADWEKLEFKCSHRVLWWPLLVPDEFVELLEIGRPDLAPIFAYYAVLLERYRSLWIIGDAGKHLLEMVMLHLGPEYDEVLAWPRQAVFG